MYMEGEPCWTIAKGLVGPLLPCIQSVATWQDKVVKIHGATTTTTIKCDVSITFVYLFGEGTHARSDVAEASGLAQKIVTSAAWKIEEGKKRWYEHTCTVLFFFLIKKTYKRIPPEVPIF